MADKNPLAYTGTVSASSTTQGVAQFNSTDFSVSDGVVSLSAGYGGVESVSADTGSAVPSSGVLTIAGGTNGIDTTATGSTVTLNFDVTEQPAIPTSVVSDSGTATPATNALTVTGASGITTSASGSTLTITGSGAGVSQLDGDTGSATPTAGVINIVGGNGMDVTATASTVTVAGEAATVSNAGIIQVATNVQAAARFDSGVAICPANLLTSGVEQFADVTLTSAQIKALRATPITIAAAPGAGQVNMFTGAIMKLNYGGTNVFTEAGDNLAIRYENGSGAIVSQTIETTGFIDQSADTITNALPKIDAIVAAANAENKALVIHNVGGAEIAGNAANDNTVTLRVYYFEQTL